VSSESHRQVGGTHYLDMHIQPWDAMEAWSTEEEFVGHLKLSAISYLARAGKKGTALQDIEKASHCLLKAVEILKNRVPK
jgi:hypothetical protein